jgi:hypothetical protein
MKTPLFAAQVALLILAAAPATRAGTYGGHSESFKGFTIQINIDIGHYAGPNAGEQEARDLERGKKEAQKTVAAVRRKVARMVRHYARGKHPYRALAGLVDMRSPKARRRRPGPDGYLELGPLGKLLGPYSGFPPSLRLHLKPGVKSDAVNRVRTDFVLSQASKGGALHGLPPRPRHKEDGVFLVGLSSLTRARFEALRRAAEWRALLQDLARGRAQLPEPRDVPITLEYTDRQGQRTRVQTTLQLGRPLDAHYRGKNPRIIKRDDTYRVKIHQRNRALVAIWSSFLDGKPMTAAHLALLGSMRPNDARILLRLMADLTPLPRLAGFVGLARKQAGRQPALEKDVARLEALVRKLKP